MSERWTNNSTTAGFSLTDVMSMAAKLTKPEPIMAFQGTPEQLAVAIEAERPPVSPLLWGIRWPDPFPGLDVVEEQGWTYIGTTSQLAKARKQWGSLSAARCITEKLQSSLPSPAPHGPACEGVEA